MDSRQSSFVSHIRRQMMGANDRSTIFGGPPVAGDRLYGVNIRKRAALEFQPSP